MKVYLELKEGKTHKFWQIEVDEDTRTITTGKVGAKKAPQPKSKTFKSAEAATKNAATEIAKKKQKEFYFDPSSIEGILEAHAEQLAIPSEDDVEAHRAELPHAAEDYFRVYRTGALSVGSFSDFAPMDEEPEGEFGEMTGLFVASGAEDFLDEDGLALDPYFYIVGHFPDGSTMVQYNQGKHAGRLGVIDHGPSTEMVEQLVEGDPDATVAAWLENELIEPISEMLFSDWVREALLHYKGAAVERKRALSAAIAAVKQAVSGNPLEVTELDLSEKSLRTLPDFLGECENLERLILRKNELEVVPEVLRKMKKLRVLDLYYNPLDIRALPGWLAELPLEELNLGLTEGETLPAVIPEIKTLEALELSELEGLPASIGELAALRSLKVRRITGPIEEGGLGRLARLTTLVVGEVKAPLPPDIGGMQALEELKLEVNARDAFPLPDSIGELRALRVLHAGGSTLPPAVCKLTGLEELKVSGNEAGLPEQIGALSSLRTLDLHYARIKTLPASFGDLSALEHLNLEVSYLEALPDSFAKLTSLRFLNLATAEATDVGDRLAGLENLEFLALKTPVLPTLRGSMAGLRKLKTLKVYDLTRFEGDVKELLGFVHDLPALEALSVPFKHEDHFREALPGVEIS